jgi:hypothetical protein
MLRTALCLALVGVALSAPALAQGEKPPVAPDGANMKFSTLGHHFTVPLPDWLTPAERLAPDWLGLVESSYYADALQAFVEFFPKGQSLRNWTTTYGVRITLEPGRSLEDYRDATMAGYAQSCKPGAGGFFTFGETTPDFFPALGFVCGAYLDSIPDLRGKGEVMVTVFRKTGTGVGIVYQEWKGRAFDPSDPSTWPISGEAFQARAAQLQDEAKLLVD